MKNPSLPERVSGDTKLCFAREHELSEIAAFLNNNQSVSLVGPEKIGKTSLMLHLMDPETEVAFGIENKTLYAYVDCRRLTDMEPVEILAHFCAEITAAVSRRGFDPEPALEVVIASPTWFDFEIALRKLNQRGLRITLLLDDFEYVTSNPRLDETFYNALRSAAGRLRLVYLISSRQPLIDLTYKSRPKEIRSSPFFNIFAQVHLGLLSEKDAHSLIQSQINSTGKEVDSQLEDFIYHLVGGHPYAIQVACSSAVNHSNDLSMLEQLIKQNLEDYFQQIWDQLTQSERGLLGLAATDRQFDVHDPSIRVILRDLMRNCLLVFEGGRYLFPSSAWSDFVFSRTQDPYREE